MSVLRRALAVLPVAALAVTAPSAHAAAVGTLPCVPYIAGQQTMPVVATGFTPLGFATIYTNSTAEPTPKILTSGRLDGVGGLQVPAFPPSFTKSDANLQTFNLIGEDKANPAAPIISPPVPFQVVRFGSTTSPAPRRPSQTVRYTARGFATGKRIYVHFRFAGITRRSVSLGVAKGPCGIATKRMRALPTKSRFGTWTAWTTQAKKFSVNSKPFVKNSFRIFRTFG